MNQRSSGALYAMNHQVYKTFSKKCETFLFNRLMTAFVRAFLFLSSLFMRNIDEMSVKVENFIKDFSNTIDAGVVLKWFEITKLENQESQPEGSDEFGMMIFLFIRNLFFEQYNFKDKYYMSWRSHMFIRIFVNYFTNSDKYKCSELLQPIINTDSRRQTDSSSSIYEEGMSLTSNLQKSESTEYSSFNGYDVNSGVFENDISEPVSSNIENDKFMDEFLNTIVGNGSGEDVNSQSKGFDINQMINLDPSKTMFDVLMEETKIHNNVEDVNFFSNNIVNSNNFQDIVNVFGTTPGPDSELINSEIPSIRTFTSLSSGSISTPGLFDGFNHVEGDFK
ncbi:hypothetical protein CANINC_003549 [Pichia inconspicua]|uniref:Uncharacterized protein n=1 Tax=Pichia inconspicua TaxID=52247 RepID=A0A4T0WYT8_9ASCO|nr:hypothetical protein CANINC_003549 [[Candida] inconspicua]